MKIRTITCIQLGGVFPALCYRTVMPYYGMPLIATILSEAGYDVKVYMEHIKAPEWDRIAESDLVCFSSMNAGADKTYQLASEIRRQLCDAFSSEHAAFKTPERNHPGIPPRLLTAQCSQSPQQG